MSTNILEYIYMCNKKTLKMKANLFLVNSVEFIYIIIIHNYQLHMACLFSSSYYNLRPIDNQLNT